MRNRLTYLLNITVVVSFVYRVFSDHQFEFGSRNFLLFPTVPIVSYDSKQKYLALICTLLWRDSQETGIEASVAARTFCSQLEDMTG